MAATFVLLPGAGGAGEVYWREAAAELAARGHTALPVDFPGADPAAGLPEYAAITDEVIGERVGVVAQSMGGFTVPMITKRAALAGVVLVNAMIPVAGETPSEWFEATGSDAARRAADEAAGRSSDLDPEIVFFHDLSDQAKADMASGDREPSATPFGQPCTFTAWPSVPIHVVIGADDRLFPIEFQRRVARERLGIEADVMPGGHLVAKSRPVEVADRLIAYLDPPNRPTDGTRNAPTSGSKTGYSMRGSRWVIVHVLDNIIHCMDTSSTPSLLPILRSRQQAELLTLLLGDPDLELTLTDLARRLDMAYASVHREVERAESAGIVTSRRIGRSRVVRADTTSPYFNGLAEVLVRAFGVVPSLAAVLAEIEGIAEAYVFGSWAARATGLDGTRPVGDIDVLILGTPDRDHLYEATHDLEDRLGRPVQVTIRDTGWLADGEGSFHDTVTSRPMVPIPLPPSSA